MDDGDRLWHAILRRPHSRPLRQVYADWLEERGDPRSELMRPGLAPRRESELLRAHELGWLGPMAGHLRDWHFKGGLLEWVSVDTDVFLAHAEEWVRRPGLLGVHLRRMRGHVAGVANCRALSRLPYLFLGHNELTTDDVRTLLTSKYIRTVRALYLQSNRIDNDGFEAIVNAPALSRLRALSVANNKLRPALDVPAGSPLRRLRSLLLAVNELSGITLGDVLGSPGLPSLRHFAVNYTSAPAGTLARLAASPAFGRLRSLRFGLMATTSADLEALAASPHARGLRTLDLEYSWEFDSDHGIEALASSPNLAGLRRLSLLDSVRGDEGFAAFGRRGALPNLRELWLSSAYQDHPNSFHGLDGLRAMLAGPLVRRLRRLEVEKTRLSGDALMGLAGRRALPLRRLAIRVGDGAQEALHDLTASGRLDRLREVRLIGVHQPGFVAAVCVPGRLPRLRSLQPEGFYSADLRALSAADFPRLDSLRLSVRADDDPPDLPALLAWPGFRRLRRLFLDERVGEEELPLVGDADLAALEELICCGLSESAASRLAGWPGLQRLRRLSVSTYDMTPEAIAVLTASPHWGERTRVLLADGARGTPPLGPFRPRLGPRVGAEGLVDPRE